MWRYESIRKPVQRVLTLCMGSLSWGQVANTLVEGSGAKSPKYSELRERFMQMPDVRRSTVTVEEHGDW